MYKSLWCLCGHLPTYKNQLHISILSWKFGWTFKNLAISLTKSILGCSSWTRIDQGMEFLMAEEELQTFSFSIIVNRTKKLRTNQSELILTSSGHYMPIVHFIRLFVRNVLRKRQNLSIKHSKFLQFKYFENDQSIIKQKDM